MNFLFTYYKTNCDGAKQSLAFQLVVSLNWGTKLHRPTWPITCCSRQPPWWRRTEVTPLEVKQSKHECLQHSNAHGSQTILRKTNDKNARTITKRQTHLSYKREFFTQSTAKAPIGDESFDFIITSDVGRGTAPCFSSLTVFPKCSNMPS